MNKIFLYFLINYSTEMKQICKTNIENKSNKIIYNSFKILILIPIIVIIVIISMFKKLLERNINNYIIKISISNFHHIYSYCKKNLTEKNLNNTVNKIIEDFIKPHIKKNNIENKKIIYVYKFPKYKIQHELFPKLLKTLNEGLEKSYPNIKVNIIF